MIHRLERWRYTLNRVRGSLARRGLNHTLRRIRQELKPRAPDDTELDLLPVTETPPAFALSVSNQPRVSIIIPMYGQLPFTLACLRSIARQGATTPFEIIVIDDASPEDPASALQAVDGVRHFRNPENQGFVGSCNKGAELAHGELLLFLNNDTQVTPGWLDALVECLDSEADCGIVGSRLVYPDGRLQEAGSTVFTDASCWNIGRFGDRNAPHYRVRRDVDYVTGAALLVPRRLFDAIGGFNADYAPAYYEDADLAFAVRDAGRRIIYEPRSLIVHDEGTTAGTNVFAGAKQQQLRNQSCFANTWRQRLQNQPPPDTPETDLIRADGPRILVVDATTPEPSRDSGSVRRAAILQLLRLLGWQVAFLPDTGRANESEVDLLGTLGVPVLRRPWVRDLPAWLQRHGTTVDAIMLCRCPLADQYLALARRHAPQARVIFDTVDLHFLREQRAAELSGNAALARRAETSRKRELALMQASDTTLVVSPVERSLVADALPGVHVELVSNVHSVAGHGSDRDARRGLVFIGGHEHPPNADAMRWLVSDIIPAIREQLPETELHLIGEVPTDVRDSLAAPGVTVHGRVDDLTPWLDGCLASVAPLRYGAGVKGKVNTAMAHGLPVIATPIATEGMHLTDGRDVLVAREPADFAGAVVRLANDPELWEQLSAGGLANVREYFSFEAARDALARALPRG